VLNCKTRAVVYHGTMRHGDTQGFDASSATGKPGSTFAFAATAFLFGSGGQVTAQGAAWATFPSCCAADQSAFGPDSNHYYTTPDGSGYYTPPA
jgi:hypothetical protein